jgi:membrane protein
MAKYLSNTKKTIEFITDRLWKVRISKVDKRQGVLIRHIRAVSLAFKGFKNDNCLTYATALTFYTLFSIVPILALVFAIAKGFGFEKDLQEQLLKNNSEYQTVLENAFVYANSMLSNAKGGVIAGFGVVLLLWSVMQLLINIEECFNEIWEVKTGRTWIRKTTDYLTIMMVGPLLVMLSGGISVAVQTGVGNLEFLGVAGTLIAKIFAFLLLALLFLFLYLVIPNIKVNVKYAFIAALVAAFFFELLGWGYIRFQIGANRLNAIYGGFAALPLFLIWVQYSWYIILLGAELAYSYENVDNFELEDEIKNLSTRYRKSISLLIASNIATKFYKGEKQETAQEISLGLDIPFRLTKIALNEFVEAKVLVEVKTDVDKEVVYQPAVTESKFTVSFVLEALEKCGVNELPIDDSKELLRINELLQKMDKTIDGDIGQLKMKDLVAL